jgi:hypothetical protein
MTTEINDGRIQLNPGDIISNRDYSVACIVPIKEKTEIKTTLIFSHDYSNVSTIYDSYAYPKDVYHEEGGYCYLIDKDRKAPGAINESLSDIEVQIKAIEEMVKGSLKVKDVEGTPKYYIDSQVILNNMTVSQDKSVSIEKPE